MYKGHINREENKMKVDEIDQNKLERMKRLILIAERKNATENKYSDKQMIEKIRKIIEEEISCL